MSHKTDATLRPFLFAFSHCVPSGRLPQYRKAVLRNDIVLRTERNIGLFAKIIS